MGRRLQARAGLRPESGLNFQLLSYAAGASYHAHTDCDHTKDLVDAMVPMRMATVLIYLTDDFQNGETEFPLLHLKLRPKA